MFYQQLKAYQKAPFPEAKKKIEADFDAIFMQSSFFVLLNKALHRIADNKSELLRVLDKPELPFQNNLAERDIREFVKRRKISLTKETLINALFTKPTPANTGSFSGKKVVLAIKPAVP